MSLRETHSRRCNIMVPMSGLIMLFILIGIMSSFQGSSLKNIITTKVEQQLHAPSQNERKTVAIGNVQYTRKTLNLAFHCKILPFDVGGGIMEFDWITNVLLGAIDRPIRVITDENARKTPRNDTLHVYLFHPDSNMFYNLKSAGVVNQGAFHMGDETMNNNVSYYRATTYVFRNYYNAQYLSSFSNVYFAPLGMKSGFGSIPPNLLLPTSQRRYVANFIGSLRANRQEMIDRIRSRNISTYLSYEHGWASKNGFHMIDYRNILRESIFTLSPWGNNPESLRLYEALEAGSIPVFQRCAKDRNPLTAIEQNHSIPQFDSWDDAADFIGKMQKDTVALDALQKELIEFWKSYKEKSQLLFRNVIDTAFANSHGYAC
jgi:hypothetical protein